jgi:hypothetical protein
MMATVDLVGIRPLMQATLAALFKFEMFDGVGDEQQTTPARACFISTDHRNLLPSFALTRAHHLS